MKVSVNVVESCRSSGTVVVTVVEQCLHGQHRITDLCLIFCVLKYYYNLYTRVFSQLNHPYYPEAIQLFSLDI